MTEAETMAPSATDEDIREIVARDEPGVGDLVTAYEEIERRYFAAVTAGETRQPSTTYATHT